jgi:hypothetical protein
MVSEVTWGTTRIPFEIERTARRLTVSLSIDPARGLIVRAPAEATVDRLNQIVKAKASWVVARLEPLRKGSYAPRGDTAPDVRAVLDNADVPGERRVANTTAVTPEFVSGETFRYLGRGYRLRVLTGTDEAPTVRLRGPWLEVAVPRAPGTEETVRRNSEAVRAALVGWYRARAATYLPSALAPWTQRLGVTPREVRITEPRARWGSCSEGSLQLNWRVIQAPRILIDYVAAHEATHLVHPNHSRAFWSTLGARMPDYDARKARLRALGPSLIW